jgi:hypothetical protein
VCRACSTELVVANVYEDDDDNNKDGGVLGGDVLNKGDDDVFIIISVIFEVWRERERETLSLFLSH